MIEALEVVVTPNGPAADALRGKIETILTDHFGAFTVDPDGDVYVDYQSVRVFVCLRDWKQAKRVVSLFSVTNVGVPVSGDLTLFLARENLSLLFGHFSLRADDGADTGDVWFGHTLLGDFLDPDELVTALSAVARMADKYDDLIRERFGGRFYLEGRASQT